MCTDTDMSLRRFQILHIFFKGGLQVEKKTCSEIKTKEKYFHTSCIFKQVTFQPYPPSLFLFLISFLWTSLTLFYLCFYQNHFCYYEWMLYNSQSIQLYSNWGQRESLGERNMNSLNERSLYLTQILTHETKSPSIMLHFPTESHQEI